jgi:serine/threonine-protein kinase
MSDATQLSTPPPAPGEVDPASDLTGRTLGEFQILRKLGQGGMGQVYLAMQHSLKRQVALKLLRKELAANTIALKRFYAEAEAVAKINHANIVQVYAIGAMDGLHYMALELVEGRNLREYLARKGALDLPLALSLMRQVAAALQRASELGIVHRDIKPENILVTRKGELKVADFGLSRIMDGEQPLNLTASGVTMGTPLYMSPEQVHGKPCDQRSDIYSFGVTSYHLLAGRPPYRGESAFDVAIQHVQGTPTPLKELRPDCPQELCDLVHKMMAKKPDERPQTARDVLRELNRLKGQVHGAAPATTSAVPNQPPTEAIETVALSQAQPRLLLGRAALGVIAVALAFLLGVGLFVWQSSSAVPVVSVAEPKPTEPEPEPMAPAMVDEEKVLLEKIDKTPLDLRTGGAGLAYRLDLGLLYLKQHRLDEADKLFKTMIDKRGVGPAHVVGRCGQAAVLAQRDKPDESNRIFLEVINDSPMPGPGKLIRESMVQGVIRNFPGLLQMVAESLNRNAINLKQDKLDPKLEPFRKPPTVPTTPRDKDKKDKKGDDPPTKAG